MTRYYLKLDLEGAPEIECTKGEFVQAERNAGFHPKGEDRGEPCTAGFSGRGVRGRVVYEGDSTKTFVEGRNP